MSTWNISQVLIIPFSIYASTGDNNEHDETYGTIQKFSNTCHICKHHDLCNLKIFGKEYALVQPACIVHGHRLTDQGSRLAYYNALENILKIQTFKFPTQVVLARTVTTAGSILLALHNHWASSTASTYALCFTQIITGTLFMNFAVMHCKCRRLLFEEHPQYYNSVR
ncbi:conserved hypothetical protein [Trichinella spiralis]|uniref:hypothetical protein n=1 Tax=Trichinella spiralis TaxID=6334 RepID=UPI0001EFC254|nr:conserved hypothetical protein [Trichinella spiralis]